MGEDDDLKIHTLVVDGGWVDADLFGIVCFERDEAEAERDQLSKDMDRLLEAVNEQMHTEYSEAAIRHRDFGEFPADLKLYELAKELEDGRKEKT